MTTQEMLEQLPPTQPDMEELQTLFGREDMQHHLYGVHIPAADSYPEPACTLALYLLCMWSGVCCAG